MGHPGFPGPRAWARSRARDPGRVQNDPFFGHFGYPLFGQNPLAATYVCHKTWPLKSVKMGSREGPKKVVFGPFFEPFGSLVFSTPIFYMGIYDIFTYYWLQPVQRVSKRGLKMDTPKSGQPQKWQICAKKWFFAPLKNDLFGHFGPKAHSACPKIGFEPYIWRMCFPEVCWNGPQKPKMNKKVIFWPFFLDLKISMTLRHYFFWTLFLTPFCPLLVPRSSRYSTPLTTFWPFFWHFFQRGLGPRPLLPKSCVWAHVIFQ